MTDLAHDAVVDADAGAASAADAVIRFVIAPHGLNETEFSLHPVESGLFALRAVRSALRLYVLAGTAIPAYQPEVTQTQAELLGLAAGEDAEVYVVVNPADGEATVNLLAPIVVNRHSGAAAQLIIESGDWPLKAPLRQLLALAR